MSGVPVVPGRAGGPFAVELPTVATSLVTVRRSLAVWLAAAGVVPEVAGALQMAVGEACANAVDHAHPPGRPGRFRVTVQADADGLLTASVTDDGTWRVPDRDPGDRGRGLLIMHQLLADVQVSPGRTGTTVTLRVDPRTLPPHAVDVPDVSSLVVDRSRGSARVVATGPLDDSSAGGLRLRLLEASRGGVVQTELDLTASPALGPAAAAVVAEVAAIGRANGWTLRVTGAPD